MRGRARWRSTNESSPGLPHPGVAPGVGVAHEAGLTLAPRPLIIRDNDNDSDNDIDNNNDSDNSNGHGSPAHL